MRREVPAPKPDDVLFAVRDRGKLGFMDARGKVRVEPRFQNDSLSDAYHEGAVDFSDWVPVKEQSLWGFIDKRGKYMIEPRFGVARPFLGDLAPVGDVVSRSYGVPQGRWGYIDRKGNYVIQPKFGDAGDFENGQAVVLAPGKDGDLVVHAGHKVIDRTGAYLSKPKPGVCGDWLIGKDGKLSLTYADGKMKIEGRIYSFTRHRGKPALADAKGKVIFVTAAPAGYENEGYASPLQPSTDIGLVLDIHKGKCGFRDLRGKVVIDYAYDDAQTFTEGMASVKIGKRWGYIDTSGKLVIEPRFEEPAPFSEGLAQAKVKLTQKIGGKPKSVTRFGFIDKKGKMVIEPQFTKADERTVDFEHGLAAVVLDKARAYIDKKGKIVWRERK